MKLVGFVKFYNEEELLEQCLSHLKTFCDDIVCCNDSCTDKSLEITSKYTNKIIIMPNDFEAELQHKEVLLAYLLKEIPDTDWIIHLDPDEVFDKPEEIRPLLERLDKEGYDSVSCNLKNLWISEDKYRVDDHFNFWWKIPIWKNTGDLKFDTSRGLHRFQNPINLKKTYLSDIYIIHYGFYRGDLIQRKYDTYKSHGQSGHMLERINPDSKAKLIPLVYNLNNPKVTVGIPAFVDNNNSLQYLKECIGSVVEQTYNEEIEILVVDDGSPKEYSEQIHNICKVLNAKVIRNEENGGIGYSRNVIINNAKGEFLYFLSADDWFMPNTVEVMMNSYKEPGFYYSQYIVYPDNRLYAPPTFNSYEDFVMSCISTAKNNGMFVCYNLFGPMELWKKAQFWDDKRYGEDIAHLLDAILIKKIKYVYIPQPLFMYRIHPDMWTNKLKIEKIATNNLDTFKRINAMLGRNLL